MNRARGSAAEDAALRYLETQGCALIERNYRCRLGELDLVMRDGDSLVFVEVRARASEAFGGGGGNSRVCKRRLRGSAARHFLMTHPRAAALPARFDVVVITGRSGDDMPCWIRAAFDGAS
jgi:putative endonuclease